MNNTSPGAVVDTPGDPLSNFLISIKSVAETSSNGTVLYSVDVSTLQFNVTTETYELNNKYIFSAPMPNGATIYVNVS